MGTTGRASQEKKSQQHDCMRERESRVCVVGWHVWIKKRRDRETCREQRATRRELDGSEPHNGQVPCAKSGGGAEFRRDLWRCGVSWARSVRLGQVAAALPLSREGETAFECLVVPSSVRASCLPPRCRGVEVCARDERYASGLRCGSDRRSVGARGR